jgi:hypothetical protein
MPMNSAFFYHSEQPERQPGNSPTPTTPLGGVGGVGERHSPVPSPSDADREEKAMAVRKAFPVCAAAAAEFAAVFPGTRMVFASENGLEIGRKGPEGVRPVLDRLGDVKPAEPVLGRYSRGARQMPLQGGARQIPLQGGAGSSVASDGAAGGLGGAGASQRRAIGGAPA